MCLSFRPGTVEWQKAELSCQAMDTENLDPTVDKVNI